MARRRRHGHRVPWGPYQPWPEPEDLPGEPEDPDGPDQLDEGPGWHRPSAGGAGVREPRRPRPTLPGVAAAADPEPDTFLDFSGPAESSAGIR